MDHLDRQIINTLQRGFPVCEKPFAEVAETLGTTEDMIITRVGCLLDDGVLTRFGPLFHAERLGGCLTLCAIAAPEERFDNIAKQVNAHPEVAHNYRRRHKLNMWFVLATASHEEEQGVLDQIEAETGLKVLNLPKEREFFVGLYLEV